MFKKIFFHECGLNVCENEWGYSWNNCSRNSEAVWEICLIKCDFTAEIQPRKTDSGTEPVFVGAVWLKKTRKSYIYHTYYVSERPFYKIHESERLPLNYAFVKSISNFVWSDVICVVIRNANFRQQTENNSDPWHERKWRHMHVRLAVNHSAALKSFNQKCFVVLTKFAGPQTLSFNKLWAKNKQLSVYTCQQTRRHHVTLPGHIWFEWRRRNRLLWTSKGMLQWLS